uniref:Rhodanese domain-containing protein n=1 Tax=Knipowitschia caucasica TaxID=637954 RepID=A0AAV2L3S9_KNICA
MHLFSRSFLQTVTSTVTEVNGGPCWRHFPRTFTTASSSSDRNVVTVAQLKSMLAKKDVQLFDVRRPDEYQAGHIPSAVSLPLDDLEVSLKLSSEDFEQKFQVKTPAKEDDNIVFNCKSGRRSGQALDIAHRLGFIKARHLQGGYSGWEEAKGKSSSS